MIGNGGDFMGGRCPRGRFKRIRRNMEVTSKLLIIASYTVHQHLSFPNKAPMLPVRDSLPCSRLPTARILLRPTDECGRNRIRRVTGTAGLQRAQLDTPTWQHPAVLEGQHRCGGVEVGVVVDDRESVCSGKCCGQQVGYTDRSMPAICC